MKPFQVEMRIVCCFKQNKNREKLIQNFIFKDSFQILFFLISGRSFSQFSRFINGNTIKLEWSYLFVKNKDSKKQMWIYYFAFLFSKIHFDTNWDNSAVFIWNYCSLVPLLIAYKLIGHRCCYRLVTAPGGHRWLDWP